MPSYEYKCTTCGGSQELERSIHAEASNPICCGEMMTRVWNTIPVKFTAPGFYSVDNPKR